MIGRSRTTPRRRFFSPASFISKKVNCFQVKGRRVGILDQEGVKGVILADHVKCIDWRKRGVKHFDTLPAEVIEEVEERLGPLIFP